ncbi:hypothetical protein ASE63_22605 [Bosea sp. Root381]|uniref:hypothetical protein n=1 Tax=Bosea sp. Root381 TaxID=1736524 RepID=UPI0006FC5885|nr:hypothetical protein [Bosea sp. Root381]KRE07493.1 hypothetical protein ASE63_22605 [Bosea sp. Root381]
MNGPDTQSLIAFLNEAAAYFERRDIHGEDGAFWSNVANAANCRKVAARLSQVDALDQERDGFASLCAGLRADLAGIKSAAKALSDPDCCFDGNNIVIRCESHGDAIKRMRVLRDAIERAPR